MSLVLSEVEALVQRYVPEFIKLLTGFEETEENFTLCQQFMMGIIRNHTFLSVNSHEIRRKMEDVIENMELTNFVTEATNLRRCYEELITDPDCMEHYVHEIHWSILLFLITVAYNPVGALKERRQTGRAIELFQPEPIRPRLPDKEKDDLIADLLKDNVSVQLSLQNSDLSDWSDLEDDENVPTTAGEQKESDFELIEHGQVPDDRCIEQREVYGPIAPPQREDNYHLFDQENALDWLEENVQMSWWQDSQFKVNILSDHRGASFCDFWSECVAKASHGFLKSDPVSTVSESCVLREILWMFTAPVDCKLFRIDDDQIWINSNVSLASTTEHGIQTFLLNFTEFMTIAYRLRNFCSSVLDTSGKSIPAPHSFECYAAGVKSFLTNMETVMIAKEMELIRQEPGKTDTIISLFHELEPELLVLKKLYDIHRFSVLDWTKYPAHIAVAHLLSGLFRSVKLSANLEKGNLAFALLLAALKCYMNMIDIWWTEGRLDDWRDEFLVERQYTDPPHIGVLTGYQARLFSKCKQRCFYVSSAISEVIENDPIIKLLLHHSLEAGYTLNILNGLDRISDMRRAHESEDENLVYLSFLGSIVEELEKFRTEEASADQVDITQTEGNAAMLMDKQEGHKVQRLTKEIQEICNDDLLLMALKSTLNLVSEYTEPQSSPELIAKPERELTNAHTLYEILNEISTLPLPLEHVLFDAIKTLMETKRQAANHYVTYIYKDEFHVMDHLRNIRKVLLLEASDLMDYFYSDLFRRIEAGESWANPYLLTTQLSDILASRYNDMMSLFTVEIDRSVGHRLEHPTVLQAIDAIRVLYIPGHDLTNMINDDTLASYNSVFRFLLKVKWALGTLEMLRFPWSQKRRPPYAIFGMMDLILKRLAMLKFWMIFSLQCVHSHLMTHVLQSHGEQLDAKLDRADNLSDMITAHQMYISTIFEHCFQQEDSREVLEGIKQMLELVSILRDEWQTTTNFTELDARGEITDNSMIGDFVSRCQIDELERTYCKCHQELARLLSREAYGKQKLHLTGLADAFSYNAPY
ncbi:gamma-tubulin complex component 5 [Anopheles darlingi]|uniref:gamma-tubulin complex component 5 n=1 Tax=Anopheles darlingi TaxID=43151 RepID=UPI00210066D5|nr:gamma-tubulin complex component 5 [Anopheles darlingi]